MKKTFIAMILDETGSMSSRRKTAIDSTNEFINAHKEIKDCFISLITFDKRHQFSIAPGATVESVRFVYENISAAETPALTEAQYSPQGMTNLYDAIGSSIRRMEAATKTHDDPTVIIMVNTDGEENSSTEFDGPTVRKMIEEKKAAGWQFVFIGEELDTQRTGSLAKSLNISGDMTINVTGLNKGAVFRGLAAATCAYSADVNSGACGVNGPQGESGLASYIQTHIDTDGTAEK